jgi:hypothetical protein
VPELRGKSVGGGLMREGVEMRIMDDPTTLNRVFMFRVSIPQTLLIEEKYVVFWRIVKYLWKVVRHGN